MVSILDWITVCIVDVCISYKTINIKAVKQVADKSLQIGPPIFYLFSI